MYFGDKKKAAVPSAWHIHIHINACVGSTKIQC